MEGRWQRMAPAERRAALLDAATELAAGGDLASLSVADIAAAAGVSEGLLYRYFASKDALILAVVRRAADALLADLEEAAGRPGSVMERLMAGLDAYLDHVQADPTGWQALLAAVAGEPAAIRADLERRSAQMVFEALQIDHPSQAMQLLMSGWTAMERAACLHWLTQPEIDRTTLQTLLLGAFASGLTSLAETDPDARQALTLIA